MSSKSEATQNRVPATTISNGPKGAAAQTAPAPARREVEILPMGNAVTHFLFTRVIEPAVRWHRRNATIRQLRVLDDRTLEDIGISRDQIPQAADRIARSRIADRATPVVARVQPLPVDEKVGDTARVDFLRSKAA